MTSNYCTSDYSVCAGKDFQLLVSYRTNPFLFSFNLSHTISNNNGLFCIVKPSAIATKLQIKFVSALYLSSSLPYNEYILEDANVCDNKKKIFVVIITMKKRGGKRQKMKYQTITPTIIGRRKQVIYIINNIDHIKEEEPPSKRMLS